MDKGLHNCDHCEKIFPTRGLLDNHVRVKHSDNRPFLCDQCSSSFKMSQDLKKHQVLHSGLKSFNCRHCDKTFAKGWTRTQHERIHLGTKPYKCVECGESYKQKNL